MYYQNHMMNLSKESGLDTIDEDAGQASGLEASERMDSLDSAASRDSISRYLLKKYSGIFANEKNHAVELILVNCFVMLDLTL